MGRTTRRRVPPLPPEDRRAAIIEATLPLLERCGATVNTRQIAQAAGVAEGTIFRVFPDKISLIHAAVLAVSDPAPTIAALEAIPADTDIRTKIAMAAGILYDRVEKHVRLFAVAREMILEHGHDSHLGQTLIENRARIMAAVTKVIEPDADNLRVPASTAARFLSSMIAAANGRMLAEPATITNDEIVTVLLDGLLKHPDMARGEATTHRPGTPPGQAADETHTTAKEPPC